MWNAACQNANSEPAGADGGAVGADAEGDVLDGVGGIQVTLETERVLVPVVGNAADGEREQRYVAACNGAANGGQRRRIVGGVGGGRIEIDDIADAELGERRR